MTNRPVLEHLASKAEEIRSNPNGKYDCSHLARELKEILLAEGKEAEVLRFGVLNQYGEPECNITPVMPQNKSWSYHDVCCSEEKIYDPLFRETPIPLNEYPFIVFRTDIPYHTEEELETLYRNAASRPIRM